MDMSTLVESVCPEAVLLSCPLTADGQKAPFLMAWVRRHGQLPSAVMAQLAEAGFQHAVDLTHVHSASPTDGVDQRVVPGLATGSVKIRLRTALHPLAHPRLIEHLRATSPEWHRRTLLHAIEMGIQAALGARRSDCVGNEVKHGTQGQAAAISKAPDKAGDTSTAASSPSQTSKACVDDMPALMLGDLATLFPTSYG